MLSFSFKRRYSRSNKLISVIITFIAVIASLSIIRRISSIPNKPIPSTVHSYINGKGIGGALSYRNRVDWMKQPQPKICSQIFESNRSKTSKNCTEVGEEDCDFRPGLMFSQYGEDYYLYTRHFVHYNNPGFYLDIATNQ